MLIAIVIIAGIGLAICTYGLYIEKKIHKDAHYKAVCDLSDRASCTKTILSPWGKMLGVSNFTVGWLFYALIVGLGLFDYQQIILIGAIAAAISSLFLAYILYTKVQTFCLICVSIYCVNAALLCAAWLS